MQKVSIGIIGLGGIGALIASLLKEKKYTEIYDQYFSTDITNNISKDDFTSLMKSITDQMGNITDYKKLQWNFVPLNENGKEVIFCTKIVEYEKSMMIYSFGFVIGNYKKAVGFKVRKRTGVMSPGEL